MTKYRPRVVDAELRDRMSAMGAILVDGPKAVGKTSTASQVAQTVLRIDVDRAARAALEVHPDQLFTYPGRVRGCARRRYIISSIPHSVLRRWEPASKTC